MRSLRELFLKIKDADGGVRDLLRSFNFQQGATAKPQSVKALANKLGIDVDRQPLAPGVSGYLEQDPFSESGYRIVINSLLSIQRQRWAVLHEIGHYLMHRNDYDLFRVEYLDRSASSFYEVPAQEREADEFAATLLFGDGALEAAIGSIGNNPMALARRFGVTEQVIKIAVRQFIRTTR